MTVGFNAQVPYQAGYTTPVPEKKGIGAGDIIGGGLILASTAGGAVAGARFGEQVGKTFQQHLDNAFMIKTSLQSGSMDEVAFNLKNTISTTALGGEAGTKTAREWVSKRLFGEADVDKAVEAVKSLSDEEKKGVFKTALEKFNSIPKTYKIAGAIGTGLAVLGIGLGIRALIKHFQAKGENK